MIHMNMRGGGLGSLGNKGDWGNRSPEGSSPYGSCRLHLYYGVESWISRCSYISLHEVAMKDLEIVKKLFE